MVDTQADFKEVALEVVTQVPIQELTPRVVVLEVDTQELTPRVVVLEVATKEATQEHTHRVLMAVDTMVSVAQIKDPVRPEVLWEEVKKSNPNPKAMQRLSQQNRFQDDKTVLPNGGHYTTQW